ncbi:helix-turn-helix domain-containing protein [Litoribacter populi]|uniref:helix-turn-helix domain-containing protein n=1 Tax=Litoribacter populi TaxID=2598460 RepID=UPI0029394FE7|nr:helix-turn-helix domain-containing protein [Litoribacter populi]
MIEDYENKHFPIEAPDPIDAIKIRMEDLELQQKDLIPILGQKSRVSEVLNRKRKLNLDMVRKLSQALNIPLETLAQDYSLDPT